MIDPGTVVWLPGTGYTNEQGDAACQQTYGQNYHLCGGMSWGDGTLIFCCS